MTLFVDTSIIRLPLSFPSTVVISMYTAFLIYKCKQRRKGSYNVHLRQQVAHKSRQDSDAELGTASVHSSFRDITERYQRELALSGAAELGCTRGVGRSASVVVQELGQDGSRWSRSDGSEASSSCGLIDAVHNPELHPQLPV